MIPHKLHGSFLQKDEHNYKVANLSKLFTNNELDYKQIYNSLYYITSSGEVFRLMKNGKPRFRKPCLRQGYLSVILKLTEVNKWYRVHRLVCICYHSNDLNKPYVNHIDGNKLNNEYSNLEWCTSSENNKHSLKTGLRIQTGSLRGRFGQQHPKSIPVIQYDLEGNFIKEWESMNLAETEGFNNNSISKCCSGKQTKHHNYVWKYK